MTSLVRRRAALALSSALLSGCSGDPADSNEPPEWQPNPACVRQDDVPACAAPGFEACEADATPDHAFMIGDPGVEVEPPYDNPSCPGRVLYEVETAGFVATTEEPIPDSYRPLWIRSQLDVYALLTPEECHSLSADVAVQREIVAGSWEDWDAFRVLGTWNETLEACQTAICGGGRYPDGTFANISGAPHTWVEIENALRVRAALSAQDGSCNQQKLMFGVSETL